MNSNLKAQVAIDMRRCAVLFWLKEGNLSEYFLPLNNVTWVKKERKKKIKN